MNDTSPEIAEMVCDRMGVRSGSESFRVGVQMCIPSQRMFPASLLSKDVRLSAAEQGATNGRVWD